MISKRHIGSSDRDIHLPVDPNGVDVSFEVCIQSILVDFGVTSAMIEGRIRNICLLFAKTELEQTNEVGKYKFEKHYHDLQDRLVFILRVFHVLGVAIFFRSSLTLRLRFVSLLVGLLLGLFFAPDFLAWARPKLGWSQNLGLARSRNVTGAWL